MIMLLINHCCTSMEVITKENILMMAHLQIVSLLVALLVAFLAKGHWERKRKFQNLNLPPGPPPLSMIRSLLAGSNSIARFHDIVHLCWRKYGPIFTLWNGNAPLVVIADRQLAHEALLKKQSVVFAGRPPAASGFRKRFTCNGMTINSVNHGSLWKNLRSNLVSNILSQSSIAQHHEIRDQAILCCLNALGSSGSVVRVREHLRSVLNSIMFTMCFGVVEPYGSPALELVHKAMWDYQASLISFDESPISVFLPHKRKLAADISALVRSAMLPHIRRAAGNSQGCAYAELLNNLTVEVDGKKRKLTEDEILVLCVEFMIGGVDTSATTLEWALAHLVDDQGIQAKLHQEISRECGDAITEENAKDVRYLLAVVKETLRIHHPAPTVLPHAVLEDAKIGGYDIPKGTRVSFYGHAMAMDSSVWKEPSVFRPERFMDGGEGENSDLTGTKEMAMLPFGAGRRVCAGMGLGMLHLTYILARLVQHFRWETVPGHGRVDFSHAHGVTVMMKHPLQALITERTAAAATTTI